MNLTTQPKSPWHCPKCGQLLVRKEGRYGEFMACPSYPECRYTRALWTYGGKPPCTKCNGKGLLPFVKDGRVISHAFVDCSCKAESEHYCPVPPEHFDFPYSDTFRGFYFEEDMPYQPVDLEERINDLEAMSAQQGSMPRHYQDRLQQLEARVLHAEARVQEHISQKRQKGKY